MKDTAAHLALALLGLLGEALLVGNQRGQAAVARLNCFPQPLLLLASCFGICLGLKPAATQYFNRF